MREEENNLRSWLEVRLQPKFFLPLWSLHTLSDLTLTAPSFVNPTDLLHIYMPHSNERGQHACCIQTQVTRFSRNPKQTRKDRKLYVLIVRPMCFFSWAEITGP